jgi:long-chain acyl-CoA synthetase
MYAQTEVTGLIATALIDDPMNQAGLSGTPGMLTRIEIFSERGNLLSPNRIGEICVKAPTVFEGYWSRLDDNRWIFRDGWLHTGDLGLKDDAGRFWFKGRKPEKDLIKTGGENVYPAQVESTLRRHPAV